MDQLRKEGRNTGNMRGSDGGRGRAQVMGQGQGLLPEGETWASHSDNKDNRHLPCFRQNVLY